DSSLKEIVELHFQGGLNPSVEKEIKELGLEELVFNHGYKSHKESVENLLKMDVLWLIVGHQLNAEKVTLGKMFEYFGTRKPILALVPDGGSRDLLKEYKASYIA